MTIAEWIEGRREFIDRHIRMVCSNCTVEDDEERELWVSNDEFLYTLAIEEGYDPDEDDEE